MYKKLWSFCFLVFSLNVSVVSGGSYSSTSVCNFLDYGAVPDEIFNSNAAKINDSLMDTAMVHFTTILIPNVIGKSYSFSKSIHLYNGSNSKKITKELKGIGMPTLIFNLTPESDAIIVEMPNNGWSQGRGIVENLHINLIYGHHGMLIANGNGIHISDIQIDISDTLCKISDGVHIEPRSYGCNGVFVENLILDNVFVCGARDAFNFTIPQKTLECDGHPYITETQLRDCEGREIHRNPIRFEIENMTNEHPDAKISNILILSFNSQASSSKLVANENNSNESPSAVYVKTNNNRLYGVVEFCTFIGGGSENKDGKVMGNFIASNRPDNTVNWHIQNFWPVGYVTPFINNVSASFVDFGENGTSVRQWKGNNLQIDAADIVSKHLDINGTATIGQNTNGTAVIDAYGGNALFGNNRADNGIAIDDYGRVGIGYTTPNEKLSVKGVAAIGQYTNGTAKIDAYDGKAYYGCDNATNGIAIDQNGNVGVGNTAPNAKLAVKGVTAIGQYTNGTAMIDAYGGNAYYGNNQADNGIAIDFYGKVGIGVTIPGEKLDVNGTIKASNYKTSSGKVGATGSIYINTADGSLHIGSPYGAVLRVENGLLVEEQ